MKLKRFMAIVISLAMVLSIVPAFSLTASAASSTTVIDSMGATVVWNAADGSFSDTAVATAWDGWSSTVSAGYTNVTTYSTGGNVLQFYTQKYTTLNSTITTSSAVQTATSADDVDKLIIEFKMRRTDGASDLYFDYYFRDNNGVDIAYVKFDKNTTSVTGNYKFGFPASGTDCAMVIYNNDDGSTHTVEYYVAGSLVMTDSSVSGVVSGFGSIYATEGYWNQSWAHIGFGDLTVATYTEPDAAKTITATYTAGGTTVKEVSKTIDTSATDSASFDEYYYAVDGESVMYYAAAQTLTDSATIAMTEITGTNTYAVGLEFAIDSVPYEVTGTNLIPNGDFQYGLNGWLDGTGAAATQFTVNGDGTVTSTANTGNGGNGCLYRSWPIEAGETYAFVYDEAATAGDGNYRIFSLSNSLGTDEASVINKATAAATQNVVIFTNSDNYAYAKIRYRWNGTDTFGNFGLYKVKVDTDRVANTTIKFVDSADNTTEIADAVTITGIVGDVIDLSAYSSAITYNGNPYSFDSTNATSYTVEGNNDVVTLTYTTDAYVSFEGTPVTVIAGNDPVLSTTVTAKTGNGSTTVVDGAVWTGYTGLSAGTHTINGTVTIDGTTISGTTTVTVLPMTFEPGDLTANGTITFPVNVTGDFYVEFDFNATNLDNEWIYISKDSALWSGGQIGLGFDNAGAGQFKAQPQGSTVIATFDTNKTYRFLVHGNIDSDTYDLTVYDTETAEVVATVDDYAFRTASDYVNTIVVSANGEGGNAALSNVKVYAPDQADSFTTITFTATGSVSDSYTTSYTSAEEFPIPHYDGHIMKTRTVSGSTVTATYEATTTSIGSWYMRNNFTDDNWITESKYIGSHNAFADDDSVFENEGGDLYGDTGATGTSSTYVANSRTQSVGVVDQLNAGVRYFDVRLSRQSDGTFATVHGPAFENFRDIAISMAQWAEENPGEVIILDFQSVRDAQYTQTVVDANYTSDTEYLWGPDPGDDNQYVYDALVKLFEDTGLADYMTTNWDRKYGALTSSGTVTAILPFGKGRAVNCQGGYFVNRSALNNDVTYTEESSYSDVVSYLDSTYDSLTNGATISTIHAYTTPFSFLIGTALLEAAQDNNPNWINETNFYNWMAYGKGDVFMMNDSVSDIDVYYEALNKFNRTGSSYSYTADFTRTTNDVTITGAQANVPFSTKWTVTTGDASAIGTLTISGTEYTPVTAYNTALMQFNTDSVQPTGSVTLTFPQVSDGSTTVDVLLSSDGSTVLATAAVGEAITYSTTSLGNYILATKVAPGVNVTVKYVADGTTVFEETKYVVYGYEAYNVPAGDFYIAYNGNGYIVNSASAQSYTVSENDANNTTLTVSLTMVSENAVLEDILVDPDNNIWGINATNTNSIFVAAAGADRNGPDYDADGAKTSDEGINPATLGSNRNGYVQFKVVDLADGEAAIAKFYVRSWHGNTFANGNTTIRLSATAINDDSWTTLTDGSVYTDTAAPQLSNYTTVMFSSKSANEEGYITFDVTEMMKAAKEAGLSTISMRLATAWGAAYIVEREAAVIGGSYPGKAAYIDVVDANSVTVTGATKVTKNGTDVTAYASDLVVPTDSTIVVYADAAYVTDGTNVYTAGAAITTTSGATYYPASLGVAMVNGAQVRIGDGVNADGSVAGDSGLRFITTVNGTDSLAALNGATFGVEVTAESSDTVVDIPATKWQTEDEVFTTALTNLAVSNYNRNFTAKPYVSVNGTKYYGSEVTRSIYQVASGLLKSGYDGNYGEDADKSGTDYTTMPEVLVKVLNGYVNQVGVRLVISDGLLAASDKYTGDGAFFTVSNATLDGTTYTCTLTPNTNTVINTELFSTYVRINNNNSKINTLVEIVDNGDGTYALTFNASTLQSAE